MPTPPTRYHEFNAADLAAVIDAVSRRRDLLQEELEQVMSSSLPHEVLGHIGKLTGPLADQLGRIEIELMRTFADMEENNG